MNDPLDLLHLYGTDSPFVGASAGDADDPAEPTGTELVLRGDHSRNEQGLGMLVSWGGHTDAGTLGEQLADSLLGSLPHRPVASFDVDQLFDYRSRRPHITFTENRFTDYRGPQLDLYEVKDSLGRPFLLLTGDEPDFQWERVSSTVLEIIERLEVKLVVLVDSLGLPVPHTRPLGVTAHGNRHDLIDGISTWGPSAQLESGLSQMLELRIAEAGHDVVGYTLHVPHYLAQGKYPQVAVAALEYSGAALELMLPTDELREAARMVDQDISRQVSQNGDVQMLVERLEKNFDEHATTAQRSLLVKDDEAVPDAEELGAAVEAYLRTQPEQSEQPAVSPQPLEQEPMFGAEFLAPRSESETAGQPSADDGQAGEEQPDEEQADETQTEEDRADEEHPNGSEAGDDDDRTY